MRKLSRLFSVLLLVLFCQSLWSQSIKVGVIDMGYQCYNSFGKVNLTSIADPLFRRLTKSVSDFGLNYRDTLVEAILDQSLDSRVELVLSEDSEITSEYSPFRMRASQAMTYFNTREKYKKKYPNMFPEPDEQYYEGIFAYAEALDVRYLGFLQIEGMFERRTHKGNTEIVLSGPIHLKMVVIDGENGNSVASPAVKYGKPPVSTRSFALSNKIKPIEFSSELADDLVLDLKNAVIKGIEEYERKLVNDGDKKKKKK